MVVSQICFVLVSVLEDQGCELAQEYCRSSYIIMCCYYIHQLQNMLTSLVTVYKADRLCILAEFIYFHYFFCVHVSVPTKTVFHVKMKLNMVTSVLREAFLVVIHFFVLWNCRMCIVFIHPGSSHSHSLKVTEFILFCYRFSVFSLWYFFRL